MSSGKIGSASSRFVVGLAVGSAVGLVAWGLLGGVWAFASLKSEERAVKAAWPLTWVLVADQEVSAGDEFSEAIAVQRLVPTVLATSSVVRADADASIFGRTSRVSVPRGEPFLWTYFAAGAPPSRLSEACTAAAGALQDVPAPDPSPEKTRARLQRSAR